MDVPSRLRSWIASLAIAALCGIVGLVAGGLVAGLAAAAVGLVIASLSVLTFTGTRAGITRVAAQLDRTLASGRLDALFEADPPRLEP